MTPLGTVDNVLLEQNEKSLTDENTMKEKAVVADVASPSNQDDDIDSSTTTTTTTTKMGALLVTKPRPSSRSTVSQSTTMSQSSNNDQRYSRLQRQDQDQALVQTPYGPGLVIRTRRQHAGRVVVSRDIELTDWKARTVKKGKPPQPAMLYSPVSFPSVPVQVGSDVLCGNFGRGRVLQVASAESSRVKVQLSAWRLAGRSTVTCYFNASQLQVVRPKLVYEMNVFERVDHAHQLKEEARTLYAQKEFERALSKYALAVDAVRYVQHSAASTNYVRADLLLVMMTCCNNASTCAASQKQWDLVVKYATNALVLIQALEERHSTSKVFAILHKEGYTATKIFGEWKGKSLFQLAKAAAEQGAHEQALRECKTALDAIAVYLKNDAPQNKVLLQYSKEIRRLMVLCKERKQAQLKLEKKRAQAMFGGGGGGASKNGGSPPSTPTPKSPATKDSNDTNNKKEQFVDDASKGSVTCEDGGKPRDAHVKMVEGKDDVEDDGDHDDEFDDEQEALPWYQEHQELIVLATGLAVGVGLTQLFLWKRNQ